MSSKSVFQDPSEIAIFLNKASKYPEWNKEMEDGWFEVAGAVMAKCLMAKEYKEAEVLMSVFFAIFTTFMNATNVRDQIEQDINKRLIIIVDDILKGNINHLALSVVSFEIVARGPIDGLRFFESKWNDFKQMITMIEPEHLFSRNFVIDAMQTTN